ncbi:protein BOLA4, chloroplastic/mitochondrial-like isoform X2 [Fagus crenata]
MAKTLMVRPYVFAASSRAVSSLFLRRAQPTRLFVSAVLFNKTRATCTKLQAHNDGNNCIGEAYGSSLGFGFGFGPVSGRRFSTRATNVNDAGSIDSPLMHSMEKKIKEHLDAESVTVRDAYGDGRHVR